MATFEDLFGNRINLTKERWEHIALRHPEIKIMQNALPEVLKNPDIIVKSRHNEAVKLYHKKHKNYYTVVLADISKKFIITAYISYHIKKGEVEWKKN